MYITRLMLLDSKKIRSTPDNKQELLDDSMKLIQQSWEHFVAILKTKNRNQIMTYLK